jgi:hypothetical protein
VRSRRSSSPHAFVYRAGIGLAGTQITCDAAGFPSDLIFLSHAQVLGQRGPAQLAGAKAKGRRLMTTETTLRLLGADRSLRSRTLPAAFGQPFNLGGQRIEIVPSGYWPGAAALLCETSHRRVYYLGACAPEVIVPGLGPAEPRRADAVCLDARAGDPRLVLPSRRQTLADIRAFARRALDEGRTPVLLISAASVLPSVASDLRREGLILRAHPRLGRALAELHDVCAAIPVVAPAGRRLRMGEVWLWPADRPGSGPKWAALRPGHATRVALVMDPALEALKGEIPARASLDEIFTLTLLPGHQEILSLLEDCGAQEVALLHASSDELLADLRGRGFAAYSLGPPRQMTLGG